MSRPIWKGSISFGLVTIPVTLYSGETSFDLHFRLMDKRNNAGIRYERINETTGEEVPWNQVVKGYEYSKNNYIVLTEEDFKHADVQAFQTIEIQDFVERDDIELIYFQKPYYLVPQKKAEKGYVLLREILRETKKVGVAKVVIRTRQYIAAIFPCCEGLVLNLLRYKQELKHPSDFDLPPAGLKSFRISPKEMEMAQQLVESLTTKWDPGKYHDEYRDNLMKWIQKKAKAHGKPVHWEEPEETEEKTEAVDMLELLRQSIKNPHNHNGHNAKAGAHAR